MRDGAEILHVSCLLFVQTLSLVGRKLLAKKVKGRYHIGT